MTDPRESQVPDEELFDDDTEDTETQVEISTPDPDLDRDDDDDAPMAAEGAEQDKAEGDDDEADRPTPRMQKRFDQLTARAREAERARQANEQELARLKRELEAERTQGLDHAITTLEGQAESLRAELRTAKENGDTDKELEVQDKLDDTRAALRDARSRKERAPSAAPTGDGPHEQQQQQRQQPQPGGVTKEQALAEMPPHARAWAESKEWLFDPGKPIYRNTVMGIAAGMVTDEGRSDSDPQFYQELDRRVAAAFPHLYQGRQAGAPKTERPRRQGGSAVAGPSRTATTGSKRTLTPEHKANMARFGLDPRNKEHQAEYARNLES